MAVVTRAEYLEIAGVPLATPAWEIVDLSPLFDAPEVRGSDRIIPRADGVLPFRRRITATRKVLPMVVYGTHDRNGIAASNARAQLLANLDYLRTYVVDPPSSGNGTRLATWYLPGGGTRSAYVTVLGPLQIGALGPVSVRCTLDLIVPAGRFV